MSNAEFGMRNEKFGMRNCFTREQGYVQFDFTKINIKSINDKRNGKQKSASTFHIEEPKLAVLSNRLLRSL